MSTKKALSKIAILRLQRPSITNQTHIPFLKRKFYGREGQTYLQFGAGLSLLLSFVGIPVIRAYCRSENDKNGVYKTVVPVVKDVEELKAKIEIESRRLREGGSDKVVALSGLDKHVDWIRAYTKLGIIFCVEKFRAELKKRVIK